LVVELDFFVVVFDAFNEAVAFVVETIGFVAEDTEFVV
jgi:hypothetical protein